MPPKCDSTSAIYGLVLLASTISLVLGALSWARTTALHLPLPTWIPATTTLITPLALIAILSYRLFVNNTSQTQTNRLRFTLPAPLLSHIHTILLTTLGTLVLSYLFPADILSCHLENQWQTFFAQKDAHAIRAIQDRFQCCGLRSIHDRAWPFKDRTHGDNACELQMGYRRACVEPWTASQRSVSWMAFAAVLGGLIVKIAFAQLSARRASWMDSRLHQANGRNPQRLAGNEDAENEGEARRTLLPHSRSGQENVWDVD
ncbi:uncharacterized protein DSM5745_05427 [Aspergillus mulundensis]|uniref:Tetraspanin Tsp3 n=1 Tax=Aspergillus mulundensis TaxID=1810919 RepID=A0A3D8RX23_9EURO|nr:Uncharacterized protein DSM5745_05427 [Aspergillus mulundensis]RDW78575.1 Uncharacterized protein DSM5745_05427 [Aspergillus mulundensis]